jgi:hypothetical protein
LCPPIGLNVSSLKKEASYCKAARCQPRIP